MTSLREPPVETAGPAGTAGPGLAGLEAESWDAMLAPGQGGLRHGFLLAWERAELPGLASRPVVLRDRGGRTLAAAAGYRYDLDMSDISHPILPGLVARVRRLWPRFLTMPVYELGGPTARTDPLMLSRAGDPEEAAPAIVSAAVEEARRAGARMIVVQDTVDPEGPLAGALAANGFAAVATLPTAVLDTRGYESFEGYVGAMRSKYRRRTRCVLRDSAHLRAERVTDFAPLAGELARLWRLVYDRATETRREILTAEFFTAAAGLPETSVLVLRRQDRSIAVFGLLLEDRPWLHFLHCGFEAEAGRSEAAYFRLLFEIVRTAIDGAFQHAHLGCTTLGPKLDVGAVPVQLSAWLRHENPLLQRLFVTGGNGRFAPPQVTPRRVFSA